ncbi:MAG: hypothetical protein ACLFUJ_00630 [Phycisphaerae bacterium]
MKSILIGLLVLANFGLLTALMVGPGAQQAPAQMLGASKTMISTTMLYDSNQEANIIIDIARRKLAAVRVVPVGEDLRLQEIQGRDLSRDFAN